MTVGERLREARERRKVSLHAIAEKTNVSARFLEAIEKGQYDKLPGGIFTRGFIRSYAVQVGLDPDAIVAQFLSDEPGQRDDDIDEAPPSSREGAPVATMLIVAVGVIAAALLAVYLLKPDWIGSGSRSAPVQEPVSAEGRPSPALGDAQSEVVAAVSAPVALPTPDAPGQEAPATTDAGGSAPAASTTDVPLSPLRLVIAPTGRCWVQVSADGQMRVAREVSVGERITVDASERLSITAGDAGAFAYELNGRPGTSLGAAGRVARATIVPSTVAQFQVP